MLTMPRISGRSSLTTTSPMRFRPSVRSVSRWLLLAADLGPRLGDLEASHVRHLPQREPRSSAAGATCSSGRPRRAATASGRSRPLQRRDRRVHDVDGVVRAERLAQHVVDAGALEHGAHRTTGDDAGTGAGRTQQHDAGSLLALDGVRDRALDARDLEEVLLGLLDTLGDRGGHLLGLAVADADGAVAVADHDERGEAEATAALDDLGDAVDRDDALDVRGLLGRAASAVVTTVAAVVATARLRDAGSQPSDVLFPVDDFVAAVRRTHQKSSPAPRAPSASAATRPW